MFCTSIVLVYFLKESLLVICRDRHTTPRPILQQQVLLSERGKLRKGTIFQCDVTVVA